MLQAQYWSCLHGLLPMVQPPMAVAVQDRLYSQVNAVPVALQNNAVLPANGSAHLQQPDAEAHLQRDIVNHDDAHQRLLGFDGDGFDEVEVLPSQHAAVHAEASVHAEPGTCHQHTDRRPVAEAEPQFTAAQDDASDHVLHSLPSFVNVPQCPGHEQMTDQGQSGHRLLASSQDPPRPLDKSVHKAKLWAQSCQGKSHQRLVLMTALHKTAHKQLKRQQKHAGHDPESPGQASLYKHV